MKLTVVVPCFNEERDIQHQLAALARQPWDQPWEVIVSDNGSTDGTRDRVMEMKGRLPNLCLIDASRNPGAAYARNAGVEHAQGEFIVFCDADDEVAEGYIPAMAAAIEKFGFVAGRLEFTQLNHDWVARKRPRAQETKLQSGFLHPFLPVAGGCTLGIKRSIHDEVGGFDNDFGLLEDLDYCLRVQMAGHPLHFVPEAILHYRCPTRLWGAYKQLRSWGVSGINVRRRHWPEEADRQGIWHHSRRVVGQALRLFKVRSADAFLEWTWRAVSEIGMLEGVLHDRANRRHSRSRKDHAEPTETRRISI